MGVYIWLVENKLYSNTDKSLLVKFIKKQYKNNRKNCQNERRNFFYMFHFYMLTINPGSETEHKY